MAPYRILTDSTTDLSPALVEKMNVTVLSLMFTMDGKTYRNTPDEADMPSKVFYDKVRAGSMPTTSQITPHGLQRGRRPHSGRRGGRAVSGVFIWPFRHL